MPAALRSSISIARMASGGAASGSPLWRWRPASLSSSDRIACCSLTTTRTRCLRPPSRFTRMAMPTSRRQARPCRRSRYTAVLIVGGILGILGGGLVMWLLLSALVHPSADRSSESGEHAPVASVNVDKCMPSPVRRPLARQTRGWSYLRDAGGGRALSATRSVSDAAPWVRCIAAAPRQVTPTSRSRSWSADLEVDDAVRARFAREAKAAASLQHRKDRAHLVEASLDDDPPFIVMEFLRGRSLAARLKRATARYRDGPRHRRAAVRRAALRARARSDAP